jgi:hypothetical protein
VRRPGRLTTSLRRRPLAPSPIGSRSPRRRSSLRAPVRRVPRGSKLPAAQNGGRQPQAGALCLYDGVIWRSPRPSPLMPEHRARPRSGLRELTPSLVKILRRCHSTVRGLMNNWAPISGFVWPSPASRATCASCAVSSSRVSTVRLRIVAPVARSSRWARSANPSRHGRQHAVGDVQLFACVDAAALAPQPFAV